MNNINLATPGKELCDLHIHSTASDGTLTPGELVQKAVEKGIRIMAITDHDTDAANEEAIQTGETLGVRVIPGIEISVEYKTRNQKKMSLHVLGLGIHETNSKTRKGFSKIRDGRRVRNPKIVRKLNLLGYPITLEEVKKFAGGDIIGRPHIARALMEKGFVASSQEAFDRFLEPRAPAYIHRYRPDVKTAVDLIESAGGIPVLAHPGIINTRSHTHLKSLILELKKMGIKGIEVHYPLHSQSLHDFLVATALEADLLITGGSDFHGGNKPNSQLGQGTARQGIPVELGERVLEALKSACHV